MVMRKKGSIDDIFFMVILSFIIGATTLIMWVALSKVNVQIQASADASVTQKAIMTDATDRYVGLFDGVFLSVVMLLAIAIIFLAYQIDTNPIFFPIMIILLIVLVIISAVIGNTYYSVASSSELTTYADDFTIIPFFFNNIVLIMLGFATLVGVVLYAKTQ